MQEHIRRAHPEHYISKLPATEESFQLMINTPPSERPLPPPTQSLGSSCRLKILTLHLPSYGDQHQYTAMMETPTMLRMRAHLQHPERWMKHILPLAPQQLWHSYTTICPTRIGNLRQSVLPSDFSIDQYFV